MELMKACIHHNIDIPKIIELLEKGADINIKDEYQNTPLHISAREGNVEVVKMLLDKGADINVKNSYHDTPLHLSARNGCVEVVKMLLEKGADVNVKDVWRSTPLYLSVHKNNVEIVKMLLEKGADADVNVKGVDGDTPLHLATTTRNIDMAKILLEKGADISIDCNNDKNNIITTALKLIELEKICKKITKISDLLKNIYGLTSENNLDTMEIIENMLEYSPDNKDQVDLIKKNFEKISESYY